MIYTIFHIGNILRFNLRDQNRQYSLEIIKTSTHQEIPSRWIDFCKLSCAVFSVFLWGSAEDS